MYTYFCAQIWLLTGHDREVRCPPPSGQLQPHQENREDVAEHQHHSGGHQGHCGSKVSERMIHFACTVHPSYIFKTLKKVEEHRDDKDKEQWMANYRMCSRVDS